MWHIPNKVDFYITNVCNLTCEGCNRFNNYDFRGWQRWSDYADDYARWSKLVTLRAITIMGGEPFLNPTLPEWVSGLNQLFGIEVQVLTNGTRFPYVKNLYETLLYQSPVSNAKNHIGVSLHNPEQYPRLDSEIRDFLQGPIQVYDKTDWRNPFKSDHFYIDKNKVIVNVYVIDKFSNSSLTKVAVPNSDTKSVFRLHNSNVAQAHNNCSFSQFKSYHFIRGKLYKCAPAALLPEFDQQHNIDISDNDRVLINSYRPLSPDNFEEYHQEFFENIDKPIPQCKFCPESYRFTTISPTPKGSINV